METDVFIETTIRGEGLESIALAYKGVAKIEQSFIKNEIFNLTDFCHF